MASTAPRTTWYSHTNDEGQTEKVGIEIQHRPTGDVVEVTPDALDALLRRAGFTPELDYVI